ncbi:hypothetical protein [Photobacterium sp. 53610]|uniref:hypothetical protein n=1 Tax=Photobacterium sp. 53610 TaxID=3102789 RepID=UPI002ED9C514
MNQKTLLASLIIAFSGHAYVDNHYYEAPIASGKGSTAWGIFAKATGDYLTA